MTRLVYKVDISARMLLAWMPAFAGMTLAAAMAGRPNLCTPQVRDDADYWAEGLSDTYRVQASAGRVAHRHN